MSYRGQVTYGSNHPTNSVKALKDTLHSYDDKCIKDIIIIIMIIIKDTIYVMICPKRLHEHVT